MQIGDKVKQIVPVIHGEIVDTGAVEGKIVHLVEWTDAENGLMQRWFEATQLEDDV